ncbi:MAG: L-serine ammonia-lyase, iron-sulfur-dependent subunit beta [Lachnospiraceae bacterium]|nr:L-serine ammonia-lyase, iron-sulfur-dependent subunit beta [Lachnospiraceae bacterium]
MNIFDILGPVMVGPSSSHTAGAVKIGYVSRELLGEKPVEAEINLHGSFAMTGKGHGTDRALVAGILGMQPDDIRIPESFETAREQGLKFTIGAVQLKEAHPNSVQLKLKGEEGRVLEIIASSLGGGRISIVEIDGISTNFSGDYPTLIVHNLDQPGHVAEVTSMLAHKSVNIATLNLYRNMRGGYAVMVIETDQRVPADAIRWLAHLEGVIKVTYLDKESAV